MYGNAYFFFFFLNLYFYIHTGALWRHQRMLCGKGGKSWWAWEGAHPVVPPGVLSYTSRSRDQSLLSLLTGLSGRCGVDIFRMSVSWCPCSLWWNRVYRSFVYLCIVSMLKSLCSVSFDTYRGALERRRRILDCWTCIIFMFVFFAGPYICMPYVHNGFMR